MANWRILATNIATRKSIFKFVTLQNLIAKYHKIGNIAKFVSFEKFVSAEKAKPNLS